MFSCFFNKKFNKKNKNEAQVIIITIFALIISIVFLYVSTYPILFILRNLKETTDYYQAIANAISMRYIEDCSQKSGCGYDLLRNTTTYDNIFTCNPISSILRSSQCASDIIATTSTFFSTPTLSDRASIDCNLNIDNFKYFFSVKSNIYATSEVGGSEIIYTNRYILGKYNNSRFMFKEKTQITPFCFFP